MADFPGTIFEARETENLPGLVYDPSNKRNFYSEDFQNLAAEITVIETLFLVFLQSVFIVAGKLGIFNDNPQGKFDALLDSAGAIFRRYGGAPQLVFKRANGTASSPTAITANQALVALSFQGYDGSAYAEGAGIICKADGTPGSGSMPGQMGIFTTPPGSVTPAERIRITSAGNVGIGTTTPNSKFAVVGLPTSASGLATGDIWIDTTGGLNILKIV